MRRVVDPYRARCDTCHGWLDEDPLPLPERPSGPVEQEMIVNPLMEPGSIAKEFRP